ncbi:MAG: hypothetical protein HRT88_02855 [Lentisphaeraceae bacterium]|nr:hypothetical protein [Lentisphaeraceae bacterium]
MPINQLQYQIGLSLVEFMTPFKNEEPCRLYLSQAEVPYACPKSHFYDQRSPQPAKQWKSQQQVFDTSPYA